MADKRNTRHLIILPFHKFYHNPFFAESSALLKSTLVRWSPFLYLEFVVILPV